MRRERISVSDLLVFSVLAAREPLTLCGDVDPQTALTTYRAGTLNLEADNVCRAGRRRQVDVGALDVGCAGVGERQQKDGLRGRSLRGRCLR